VKQLPLHAICFDLGGTLWDDYPTELHHWASLVPIFARHGIETSLERLVALAESVIKSYSPSLTRAMVWQSVNGGRDLYEQIIAELIDNSLTLFRDPDTFRRLNPLFPNVHELLDTLAGRYKLAIISQNFAEAEQWMEWQGIRQYFQHTSLSQRERLFKPDPRLYLHACDWLGVEPTHTLMVGDRLDNDIWPANRLRMHSVRVLADPYRMQEPRYLADVPDFTIASIADLPQAISQLEAAVTSVP
jgi:HAD superfamily hydrolase (TIGR01549 family)